MTIAAWFFVNIFSLVGAAVGIFGVWSGIKTLRANTKAQQGATKAQQNANIIALTANYLKVWEIYLTNERLKRIRDKSSNLALEPITEYERVFVDMVIQHSHSVYRAMKDQLIVKIEGMRRDIAQFLASPVASKEWEDVKVLQNDDFAVFVESCRNWK